MSRAEQQPTANVVQAAAKLAFASSAAKQRVANQLVLVCKQSRHSIETVQMSLETAAQAAWLQPKVLLSQLKGDPCFRVVQGADSASGYFVGLNVARIISKGKSNTTTGILTEELPPPKGFVDGKHPIRTGQLNCKQWVNFGECAFNERCVFNHPGKPSGDQHFLQQQQQQQQQPAGIRQAMQDSSDSHSTPAAAPVPAPPPKVPAWGGAGVQAAAATPAWSAAQVSSSSNETTLQLSGAAHLAVSAAGKSNQPSTAGGKSQAETVAAARVADQSSVGQQQQQQQPAAPVWPKKQQQAVGLQPQPTQQPASAWPAQQQQQGVPQQQKRSQQTLPQLQQQQQQQQQQAPVSVPPKLPPGFAPVQYKGRPCHMLLLRGFCPMGDKCPYDHSGRTGGGSQADVPAAAQAAVPPISTSNVAAASAQAESPLAASAQPATPGGLSAPDTLPAAAAATAPVQQAAATVQQPQAPTAAARASAGQTASAPAAAAPAGASGSEGQPAAATAHRSWRELVAGPRTPQQEQQLQHEEPPPQQQQQQHDRHALSASGGGKGDISSMIPRMADKLMGWTEGNLPQLRGEPSCPFYMGTGTCKFKERCLYHHPAAAEHPECVLKGDLPRRYNNKNRPSYSRVVNHLYRVWDYDSCADAQLKIWLAKHLLGKNNPGCHMFSSSASKPAVQAAGKGFYWQPLGRYTCSMGEAGEVLHHMWRLQPDEAAHAPMPYTKKLRELLTGDPYFDVLVDKDCDSHYWVKLNVDRIKGMLNF